MRGRCVRRSGGGGALIGLESLEARRLLSAAWPVVSEFAANGASSSSSSASSSALELVVTLAGGHAKINPADNGVTVKSHGIGKTYTGDIVEVCASATSADNDIVVNPQLKLNVVLQGGSGNDTLIAGGGSETLYAGDGYDSMIAGGGTDTLVDTGGARDTLVGGGGMDSFWAQNDDVVAGVTAAETAVGAVHWLSPMALSSPAPEASGAEAGEPSIGTNNVSYKSFAGDPLFGPAGPMPDDVVQGQLGDCYFLATLAAIAQSDPNQIRQDVVELNDGTFMVRFENAGGVTTYEHVDAELPTYSNGLPAFAQLGQGNSLWVAIMEKAFAVYRNGANSYANINSGWMNEVYGDLGLQSTSTLQATETSVASLFSLIESELSQNEAVTVAVLNVKENAPLISEHSYTVSAVIVQNGILVGLTLRNPWGTVGADGYPSNNGYVTISPAQAFANVFEVTAAAA
jgi:hypothetical protein